VGVACIDDGSQQNYKILWFCTKFFQLANAKEKVPENRLKEFSKKTISWPIRPFYALCHIKQEGEEPSRGVKGMDRISPFPYATEANTAHGEDYVTQPGHSEIASSTPYIISVLVKTRGKLCSTACFPLFCFVLFLPIPSHISRG